MRKLLILSALALIFSSNGYAQFKDYNIKGGLQFVPMMPFSEFDSRFSFMGRAFVDFELNRTFAIELGGGYGKYETDDTFNKHEHGSGGNVKTDASESEDAHKVKTDIIPIDARLKITPWSDTKSSWNPYFYVGAGLLNYSVKETPSTEVSPQYAEKSEGWTGIIPAGIGTEVKLSKNVLLDLHIGATYCLLIFLTIL